MLVLLVLLSNFEFLLDWESLPNKMAVDVELYEITGVFRYSFILLYSKDSRRRQSFRVYGNVGDIAVDLT